MQIKTENALGCVTFVWLFAGTLLTWKGILFFEQSLFAWESSKVILPFLRSLCLCFRLAPMHVLFGLVGLSLIIGYLKSYLVLRPSIKRIIWYLASQGKMVPLKGMLPRKDRLVLLLMVSIGVISRFLPIPFDVRGCIDMVIGSALVHGGMMLYQNRHLIKELGIDS